MTIDAKTIQIFLPDGQPRGLRIAEITTRIVQAIQVPHTRLDDFLARKESEHVGVYLLFGEKDDLAKPVVYIGQTEDIKTRLKNHNANKDFWNSVVVLISRTQSFTQAHIKYLEWLGIKIAKEIGRFSLDNGNEGGKPFVPEPMEADVLDAFETAKILLSTLGFPVFESATSSKRHSPEIYSCKGPYTDAKGAPVEDGFVIFKGSLTRTKPVPSSMDWEPWLLNFKTEGILEPINEHQSRITQDYVATSPSNAAAIALARRANGWQEWRRNDGKTLHEVFRASDKAQDVEDG